MSLKISSLDKTVYKKVIDVISSDGLAIAPTETVYSFIIDIFSVKARDTLYKIKKRNIKKPFIMMANSINIIKNFVNVSNDVLQITEKFWPGQLTLILSTTGIGRILSGGREDLGVRIPENRFMLKLLRKMNRPVFSTSVNISNKASAKNVNDVLEFDGIATRFS
jgi:L-threonylcarbamoyladenylate synthase